MHKSIALILYSLAVVSLVEGFVVGAVAFAIGGAFAQFLGPKIEGES